MEDSMKNVRMEGMVKLLKMVGLYFVFVLIFLLGAVAQNSSAPNGSSNTPNGNSSAPNGKSDVVNGDAVKGKEIFEANCAVCHEVSDQHKVGPGLKGISKRGPHQLSDGTEREDDSPATLRKLIVEGVGAMPPVGATFSDKDVGDLIAYLMTL